MKLKEFKAQLTVGTLRRSVIYDIAEDMNTPNDLLEYLSNRGANLPGFGGTNFSSIARYTLWNKSNRNKSANSSPRI